jgi:hypothetical protein
MNALVLRFETSQIDVIVPKSCIKHIDGTKIKIPNSFSKLKKGDEKILIACDQGDIKISVKPICTCGSTIFGFDCVCDHIDKNSGDHEYVCEFCGLYSANKPKCNKCERV